MAATNDAANELSMMEQTRSGHLYWQAAWH